MICAETTPAIPHLDHEVILGRWRWDTKLVWRWDSTLVWRCSTLPATVWALRERHQIIASSKQRNRVVLPRSAISLESVHGSPQRAQVPTRPPSLHQEEKGRRVEWVHALDIPITRAAALCGNARRRIATQTTSPRPRMATTVASGVRAPRWGCRIGRGARPGSPRGRFHTSLLF